MSEFKDNAKKQKLLNKKYQKAIKKIIIGVILAAIGIAIPGSILADLFIKIPFVDSELAVLLSIMMKVGMAFFGGANSSIGIVKSKKISNEMNNLLDEQYEITETIQNNLENEKINNKRLQEKLMNYKKKTDEQDKDKIAIINNQIEEDYKYVERAKQKVK